MGKKRVSALGSVDEEAARREKAVKLEQKKLREGKSAKAPGLAGGQRVVDTAAESLIELEKIEAKQQVNSPEETASSKKKEFTRGPKPTKLPKPRLMRTRPTPWLTD
jgi:hypothetical protein